jgi:putative ABC transport system permease protein
MGQSISFGGQTWEVVGIFESGGTSFDSEIWCDATLLRQAFKRPTDIFGAVTAKLSSSDAFGQFKDALTSDPRLNIKVERENSYYENQSKGLATFIRVIGFMIAFVMAIGAVFAALNTMYAAVSARASEIATLRALGFGSGNVVASFLLESLTIAFWGGIAGCVVVLPLNGFTASTFNMATYSQLAFAFKVTPDLMVQGMIFALLMGFFGGLFPALRAARQSIAGTLRGL